MGALGSRVTAGFQYPLGLGVRFEYLLFGSLTSNVPALWESSSRSCPIIILPIINQGKFLEAPRLGCARGNIPGMFVSGLGSGRLAYCVGILRLLGSISSAGFPALLVFLGQDCLANFC